MKKSLKKRIKENKMANFDEISMNLVRDYAKNHLDKSDGDVDFNVYIVWKCKILQNWKYLISTTLSDGMSKRNKGSILSKAPWRKVDS